MEYVNGVQTIKQLRNCDNELWIMNNDCLDNSRNRIMEYERDGRQYKIGIILDWVVDLQSNMGIVDMINELDVNYRVGSISIRFINGNMINQELIRLIGDKYQNIYHIELKYSDDQVDVEVHKQMV